FVPAHDRLRDVREVQRSLHAAQLSHSPTDGIQQPHERSRASRGGRTVAGCQANGRSSPAPAALGRLLQGGPESPPCDRCSAGVAACPPPRRICKSELLPRRRCSRAAVKSATRGFSTMLKRRK